MSFSKLHFFFPGKGVIVCMRAYKEHTSSFVLGLSVCETTLQQQGSLRKSQSHQPFMLRNCLPFQTHQLWNLSL